MFLDILVYYPTKTSPEELMSNEFPAHRIIARPSVRSNVSSSDTSKDKLTLKLEEIMKETLRLKTQKKDE
jgi:hypothetical protein